MPQRSAIQNFYGTYLTGSWVITGEHRPYDPSVGYARRIIPEHRYGAWEIVGRIGRVDLTNIASQGGALGTTLLQRQRLVVARSTISDQHGLRFLPSLPFRNCRNDYPVSRQIPVGSFEAGDRTTSSPHIAEGLIGWAPNGSVEF